MQKFMFLRDILQLMRRHDEEGNPIPFDLEWRTYNRQNKTGGRLKSAKGAVLCMKDKREIPIQETLKQRRETKPRKNPNHFANRTRNIELTSKQIKKVNILLITKFNGIPVVY